MDLRPSLLADSVGGGDRRVINMFAGGNLNVSSRFDQHFDSQASGHDLSIDHHSSRHHYGSGTAGPDIRESIGYLKRSETDVHLKPMVNAGVTFANSHHASRLGNHPLHYKNDMLERIEENKTPS